MVEKLYDQWKDKNVANYFVYGNTTDNKIYDGTGSDKVQIKQAELQDMFKKGRLVVVVGTKMYNPIYVAAEKVAVVDTVSSAVAIVEYSALAA